MITPPIKFTVRYTALPKIRYLLLDCGSWVGVMNYVGAGGIDPSPQEFATRVFGALIGGAGPYKYDFSVASLHDWYVRNEASFEALVDHFTDFTLMCFEDLGVAEILKLACDHREAKFIRMALVCPCGFIGGL